MRWSLLVLLLPLACARKYEEAKPDPVRKTKHLEPSPTSAPAPAKTSAAKCVDGAAPKPGEEAPRVSVEASATEAVESVTRAEIDDALCPKLVAARKCLDRLIAVDQVFEATLEAKLVVGPGGELKVILDGGTLKDEAMRACVRDALREASLPGGPGEGRYAVRITAR